jgi:hypothetical protein
MNFSGEPDDVIRAMEIFVRLGKNWDYCGV